MAEFHVIADTLRRQRKDLEELSDSTAMSSSETSRLIEKIEELRRRAEETQRNFPAARPSS
jgi:hypothetical protein